MPTTGLTCAPVRRLPEVLADQEVLAENVLTSTDSGMTYVRAPFNVEGVPAHTSDAPAHGADTFEVLSKLGLTAEEIAGLEEDEIIW